MGRLFRWEFRWEYSAVSFSQKFKRSTGLIVSAVILVLFCVLFFLLSPDAAEKRVLEKTKTAVTAIVETDEAKWRETLHPEKGSHLMDLQVLNERLIADRIIIGRSWRTSGDAECAETTVDGEDAIRIEQKIIAGNANAYTVVALYLFSGESEGFVEFTIKR